MRRVEILDVSFPALAKALNLPEGDRIIAARVHWEKDVVELKVEGPERTLVSEGNHMQHVSHAP